MGVVDTYEIDAPCLEQKKIPGIYFACEFVDYVSEQGVELSEEHSKAKWDRIENLDEYNLIPGLKEEIKKAYEVYKKNK